MTINILQEKIVPMDAVAEPNAYNVAGTSYEPYVEEFKALGVEFPKQAGQKTFVFKVLLEDNGITETFKRFFFMEHKKEFHIVGENRSFPTISLLLEHFRSKECTAEYIIAKKKLEED